MIFQRAPSCTVTSFRERFIFKHTSLVLAFTHSFGGILSMKLESGLTSHSLPTYYKAVAIYHVHLTARLDILVGFSYDTSDDVKFLQASLVNTLTRPGLMYEKQRRRRQRA